MGEGTPVAVVPPHPESSTKKTSSHSGETRWVAKESMATEGWIPVVRKPRRLAHRNTSAIPSCPAVRSNVPQCTMTSDGRSDRSTRSTTRSTIVRSAYPSSP